MYLRGALSIKLALALLGSKTMSGLPVNSLYKSTGLNSTKNGNGAGAGSGEAQTLPLSSPPIPVPRLLVGPHGVIKKIEKIYIKKECCWEQTMKTRLWEQRSLWCRKWGIEEVILESNKQRRQLARAWTKMMRATNWDGKSTIQLIVANYISHNSRSCFTHITIRAQAPLSSISCLFMSIMLRS